MLELAAQIAEATVWIHQQWSRRPRVGIILGTGLGHFANQVQPEAVFDYEDIPHIPHATALCHKGQLACGFGRRRASRHHGGAVLRDARTSSRTETSMWR